MKRFYPRAIAPVQVVESGSPHANQYLARDISTGGLFLITDQRFEPGTHLSLVIVHGITQIQVTAQVLRSDQQGVALSFIDPENEIRRQIERLLSNLFKQGAALDEQRAAPRLGTTFGVFWSYADTEQRGKIQDLSLSGARIEASPQPPVGAEIYVYLPMLVRNSPVDTIEEATGCQARIVRHTPDGFAISFIAMSDTFYATILHLRRLARRQNAPEPSS